MSSRRRTLSAPLLLLAMLSLTSPRHAKLFADPVPVPSLESRMPGGASRFFRAESAEALARTLAVYRDRIAPGADDPLAKWCADFHVKTGVDVTDAQSLKKAGIDTARPLALSYYEGGGYIALLPVTTGRNFPYSFTRLLQRLGDSGKFDMNPAITRYGKFATFQVLRDIFFAVDSDTFILASSGPLLRNALDLAIPESGKKTLAGDADYTAFREKLDSAGGLLLFSRQGLAWTEGASVRINGPTWAGARFDAGADSLKGRLVMALDPADKNTAAFLSALRTGRAARCSYLEDMTFYMHLALDLKSITAHCGGSDRGSTACGAIKQGIELFENYFSLAVSRELLLRSGKATSFLVRKSPEKGRPDNYLLHVSKDDSVSARELRRSLFREVEERVENAKEVIIGAVETLQAADTRGEKTIYAVDDRGMFISNSEELLARALNSPGKSLPEACGAIPGAGPAGEAFAHMKLNFREESLVKTMMQLALYNSRRRLYNFVTGADTVTATAFLAGSAVVVDIDARLHPSQKINGR